MSPKTIMALITLGVFALVSFVLLMMSTPTVDAGHVGIVTSFGAVDEFLGEGIHFVAPWKKVREVSTQIHTVDDTYHCASIDQQNVHIKMMVNFSLDGTKLREIVSVVGLANIELTFIQRNIMPAANEVLKAEIALHSAADILKQRPAIKDNVQRRMKEWLGKYHATVHEISIANVKFDQQYEQAIEAKQVKEQHALQATYELQKTQKEAEIAAAMAKGRADAAINDAKGAAEALRIKGEAEAAYNKAVSESLTPNLIQAQWITKWSGALPQVTTSNQGGLLMTLLGVTTGTTSK